MTIDNRTKWLSVPCFSIAVGFGVICMLLAIMLKGFAENIPLLAVFVWFVLLPSWAIIWLTGHSGAASLSLFALVFVCQFLFVLVVCVLKRSITTFANKLFDESEAKAKMSEREQP